MYSIKGPPVVLAVSGKLGYVLLQYAYGKYAITGVMTDNASHEIVEFARRYDIPLFVGNPRKPAGRVFILETGVKYLISINYLFLFDEQVLEPLVAGINLHGSLLPKYRGRTPHVWAIINNERRCGVTAHIIAPECDSGEIIYQVEIPISENDTGSSLLEKYVDRYPQILDGVMEKLRRSALKGKPQDENLATYFGKRVPADGRIDWNWQRERIRNWVRAQTKPYPGAFTFLDNEKIFIWSGKYSDYGFRSDITNGTIIKIVDKSIIVKTPNGCFEVTDFEIPQTGINLEEGQVFI